MERKKWGGGRTLCVDADRKIELLFKRKRTLEKEKEYKPRKREDVARQRKNKVPGNKGSPRVSQSRLPD